MPRVHFVEKARKPNSLITQEDIDRANAGEEGAASYYWWQFAYSPKTLSRTPPKASQLTRSEYLGQAYEIEERIGEFEPESAEDIQCFVEELVSDIRQLGEEQQEKLYNMPEALQDSDTGVLLQERTTACETIADELECMDFEIDEDEFDPTGHEADEVEEAKAEWLAEQVADKWQEVMDMDFCWDG